MAYGVKYRLKADSVKWKDEIILDILEDGYGGAVLPRAIGAGGIVLSKESAGKVCGTNLKFTIQADTDFEYITFADMATRQYLVNLYRGGSLIWVGYLIADEYSEALINTPYDVQLTATDGLGLLKTVDYVPETDFSSTVHRVNVIDKILATINLGLPYRIAYGVTITGGTDNIFYKAYFHDDYFAGWNCYEVLEAILPPDATITQHNAQWMVRRGEQDSEATHTIYTPTVPFGNYAVTTGAGETVLSLAPIGTGDVYPIGSATVGMEYAWKSMDFYSELVKRPSFLMNYDFADGMNGWTPSVTGIAATYAADSVDYLGITGIDTAHNTAYISQSNQFDYGQKNVSQQIANFVNDDGFALELRYCLRASRLNVTAGTYSTIKGVAVFQVSITDGTDTYYLSQTDGWVDGSTVPALPVIYQQVQSIARGVEFVDLKVYADSPPVSGTVTFRAFQFYTKLLNVTGVLFCVTDVVIRTFAGDEMQDRQYYPVTMRTNGVEEAEVTIMPTDVPDIDNFEHTFYNPQFTVSGAMITSYTSGAATGTYTNLMINSLYWLHATNRQKLMGSWRGDGMHLNAVISIAVTGGRKYTVHSGAWDLLNDRIDADLLEIPGSATGSTWAIPTGTYDSSAEWESGGTRPGSSTTGNGGIISYPNYSGLFLPQATWDTYFEIVNPGTTGEYIRALRDFASTGDIVAYNTSGITGDGSPVASFFDLSDVSPTGFDGASGYYVRVNGAGTALEFAEGTTGSTTGANVSLSNLSNVAINTSLISDTDSTDDLGSSSKYWANLYVDNAVIGSSENTNNSNIKAGSVEIQSTSDAIGIIGVNTYWDGSNSKYRSNGGAGRFQFSHAVFLIDTADTGTAGNNITWKDTFCLTGKWTKLGIGSITPLVRLDLGASLTTNSLFKAGSVEIQSTSDAIGIIGVNTYWDGSNSKYRSNGGAGRFQFSHDVFIIDTAVNGNAGDNITWKDTFCLTGTWTKLGIGSITPVCRLDLGASLTTNSLFKAGTFEIQSYAINNGWLADNGYWNGSNLKYRSNGYVVLQQFISGGFRMVTAPSGTAGATATITTRFQLLNDGRIGFGLETPTAILHIKAGTATANTAPIKLTSGTLLGTPEAGAIEFLTDNLHLTISTGSARKGIVLDDGVRLTSGKIPIATTNGRLVDGQTPLSGTKVYYVADSSGGATTRKLTFINGILTSET